jgi:hypothetical protein
LESRCGGRPVGLRPDLKTLAPVPMVPIPLAFDAGLAGSVALSGWLRLGALSRGKPLTGGGGHGDDGASCAPLLGGDVEVQPPVPCSLCLPGENPKSIGWGGGGALAS